jgi:L,D-transpeptidase catalytic domain
LGLIARTVLIVALAGGAPLLAQQVPIGSEPLEKTLTLLRPGQYVWVPEAAPSGPILMVVNLATQRAMLFRNGIPIGITTISSGRPGRETPTGVFTVLQKQAEHYSSKYNNAPMPFMQRLTWQGVALHAGKLPGYPASHGCVRLPPAFAKLLYNVTSVGMTVVITDHLVTPRIAPTPELVLRASAPAAGPAPAIEWHPDWSPAGPVSVVVSARDAEAIVLRNGVIIGRAKVSVDGPIGGTTVFVLKGGKGKPQWMRLPLRPGAEGSPVSEEDWSKFHGPEAFRRAIAGIVSPGATIVVTSETLRSGSPSTPVRIIEEEKD